LAIVWTSVVFLFEADTFKKSAPDHKQIKDSGPAIRTSSCWGEIAMCNSPGVTRATNTHDITKATYLQDLVAAEATAIDVRPGQGSLKGSSNTAATRTDLADDIAMLYRGAGDGSVAMPCRDAAARGGDPRIP
jgi:hypothetical protein